MSQQPITEISPGSILFPEYDSLYDLIEVEVGGLSDAELDFQSDRWEWAAWSIRRQLSPNPPKDTDGRREESGRGMRELQGK